MASELFFVQDHEFAAFDLDQAVFLHLAQDARDGGRGDARAFGDLVNSGHDKNLLQIRNFGVIICEDL